MSQHFPRVGSQEWGSQAGGRDEWIIPSSCRIGNKAPISFLRASWPGGKESGRGNKFNSNLHQHSKWLLHRKCWRTQGHTSFHLLPDCQRKPLNSFVQYKQAIVTDGTGRLQTSESSFSPPSSSPNFGSVAANWAFGFWVHAMCRVYPTGTAAVRWIGVTSLNRLALS